MRGCCVSQLGGKAQWTCLRPTYLVRLASASDGQCPELAWLFFF